MNKRELDSLHNAVYVVETFCHCHTCGECPFALCLRDGEMIFCVLKPFRRFVEKQEREYEDRKKK